jgi:hypothetical protein
MWRIEIKDWSMMLITIKKTPRKLRNAESKKANADKIRIRSAEYHKNADKIRIRTAQYRLDNPEKKKLRDAKSNHKTKERLANSRLNLNIPII